MGATSSGHQQKILHQCFWGYAFWFCSRWKYHNFPDSCCVFGNNFPVGFTQKGENWQKGTPPTPPPPGGGVPFCVFLAFCNFLGNGKPTGKLQVFSIFFWALFFFTYAWIIYHQIFFVEWEPYEPRLTLVCLLILAKHCYFVLEQPSSSLLARHPRWEWFCNQICYVPWHVS